MALEDYKDIVGASAGFVTFCQMFSGVFLCRDIHKRGSTEKTPVTPFLGGFILSILFFTHARIIRDPNMEFINVIGIILHVGYLLFYWFWTKRGDRSTVFTTILRGSALVCLLLGYVYIENPEKVEFRFGIIITILLIMLIASPLFSLGEIIRTKSTETLPFSMIVSGLIVSAHWLLYGVIIKNNFIIFQNSVGCALSCIELMLFVIFPSKPKVSKKKE